MNFEKTLLNLSANRKKLSESSNFEEIKELWKVIEKEYNFCIKKIQEIESEINHIESIESDQESLNLTFSQAMEEILLNLKNAETAEAEELPSLIKKINHLKSFCFNLLNQEKANIREIYEN